MQLSKLNTNLLLVVALSILFSLTAIAATFIYSIPVTEATSNGENSSVDIEAKATGDFGCDESEWHFVITAVADIDAPETIHVIWEGAEADVTLDEITGNVAHYRTTDNLNLTIESAAAVIDEEWDGQFNISHGPCEQEGAEEQNHEHNTLGAIKVCKVIADDEGNIADGSSTDSTFTILGLNIDDASGVLPETEFSTPLTFNRDLFDSVEGNDAECIIYGNLTLGGYYYGQESIEGDNWRTPLYNDQHTTPVNSLDDFYPYSGELFTEDENDDASRNTNSDGHIVLTKERPFRILVILNTLETDEEPDPLCSDDVDNDGDELTDEADPACHTDGDPDNPESYDPEGDSENSKPAITLIGDDPIEIEEGDPFEDPGAQAHDEEDGDITDDIVVGGETVDTGTLGTYTITYNVTDSEGLAADEVTRDVTVVEEVPDPACSDEIDNDEDELIDSDDPGCHSDGDPDNPDSYDPNDDDETDEVDENQKPAISLLGDSTIFILLDDSFEDPGAQAHDEEDGDITGDIVVGGETVDTGTLGTYTITYNVTDSEGLAADEVTRDVIVTEEIPETACSDDVDNDGDELTDEADPACHTDGDPDNPESYDPEGDSENSKPAITLIGDDPIEIEEGDPFEDPGAQAHDEEDGDITDDIVVGGETVDTGKIGNYEITYNVTDSDGKSAEEVTRLVNVNSKDTTSTPTGGGGGGGGGGGLILNPLRIFNEQIQIVSEGAVLITWSTNKPATSRVAYGTDSQEVGVGVSFATGDADIGYESSTDETESLVTEHSILITDTNLEDTHYFRPISEDNTRAIGIELDAILSQITTQACGQYIFEFIRFGEDNNPEEVRKLQNFLNDFEGENLDVSGVYDTETFDAVVRFQNKYGSDVLSPWGLEQDTGYVYLTTRKKINEIYCNNNIPFPLTSLQQAEVGAFKELLDALREAGEPLPDTSDVGRAPTPDAGLAAVTPPEEETEDETETEVVVADEEEGSDALAAAIEATEPTSESALGKMFERIGGFFRGILSR